MFGFGKSSKKKKGKKKKKDNAASDIYRPQPVSLQRGWATTGAKQKKAAPKKAHKSHRSNSSNSFNKKQAPLSEPEVKPEPKPEPQPQAPSNPPPQHAQSTKNINAPSASKPIAAALKHAQTTKNINESHSFQHMQPSSTQAPLYEHKSVDSNISMNSAISTQSAPYQTNYGMYDRPPPSATSAYNEQLKPRGHQPVFSEGLQPQTGQPEVVGDISSWRAQQQQQQQQQQQKQEESQANRQYPNLSSTYSPDGVPSTGSGQNLVQTAYDYANNSRIKSAADEPDAINPSAIIGYNPNAPPPEDSSSSDDDDLNALMSGDAFKVAAAAAAAAVDDDDNDDDDDKKEDKKEVKAQEAKKKEVDLDAVLLNVDDDKKVEEEEIEEKESESDDDDDGGLSDWLLSIGFKKKKLALMLHALSELGLDSMEDLEELLMDLYTNSFGNQQKQWMDKIQSDILGEGIKYAQWIRFSTKAQAMIEVKAAANKKKVEVKAGASVINGAHHRKNMNTIDRKIDSKINKINDVTVENKAGFIVMQSEEAAVLEKLRVAMSVIYSGVDNMDKVVLKVEIEEKRALDSVEKEFKNLLSQIEIRKQLLIDSITRVAEDKSNILGAQNTDLRSIAAEYEDTMHSFNNILASNQNLRSRMEISKRVATLTSLVNTVLQRHNCVEMMAGCTPLIGFHCNMTPVIVAVNSVGCVTWGNAPESCCITRVSTTDWSITCEYNNNNNNKHNNNINITQDPIIAYEIQCVKCENEENLLWNFTNKEKKEKKKKSSSIITKHVTSKRIVLVGFVCDNRLYVIRVRCKNRNGWSSFSKCVLCHTKKKKKRKTKVINDKLSIIRHRGSAQDGSPNNLLFSNEKSIYKSLSNQDFINEYNGWKRMQLQSAHKNKEFNDWIIFDLGAFIELISFRIKFDVHYRWGNVPKLIYIDIANYDDASYSLKIIKKYKAISYDDELYHNESNMNDVLLQLRQKRIEQQNEFEAIWNRLTIIECKKKSGWQDFNIAQYIDESKRKTQFIRIQFVNNFDCSIEHYSKFVVEQIAFFGIQYDD